MNKNSLITIKHWLHQSICRLTNSTSPKCDAEILLTFVLKTRLSWIYAFDDKFLTKEQILKLEALLVQRISGKPIAYIIGESEFWSLPIKVSNVTLIPRPETELLVEIALDYLVKKSGGVILDMGTGTGVIALALATELKNYTIHGTDRILSAVKLARKNAGLLSINNVFFFHSYWFNNLFHHEYDMIVSNPPYIDLHDEHLKQGDIRFEPLSAIVAGNQGISDLDILIKESQKWLKIGGFLLLEHGWKQGKIVQLLMSINGYSKISTYLDYSGNQRVTCGCKPHLFLR